MQTKERSEAIGHAREHLNACYSHGSGEYVWNALAQVEAMAEHRYGRPQRRGAPPAGGVERGPRGARDSRPRPLAEDRAVTSMTPAHDVEMQGNGDARGDSLTRSVGQWLVVKVGDGPRFVAMAARSNRAPFTGTHHRTG